MHTMCSIWQCTCTRLLIADALIFKSEACQGAMAAAGGRHYNFNLTSADEWARGRTFSIRNRIEEAGGPHVVATG